MSDFENPKTPEEIRETRKKRNQEETKLYLEGARDDENGRLVVTKYQVESAKHEMEWDLEERKQKEQELKEKISGIETVLGQPISEKSKELILQNTVQESETASKQATEKNQPLERKNESEKEIVDVILSGKFKDSLLEIANVLKVRERKRLDSLINPDAIPYLESCVKDLNSITTIEGIKNSVSKITKIIKSIGEVPRQRGVNDSVEDLKIARNALGRFREVNNGSRAEIFGLKDEKTKELLEQMHFLDEVLKEKLSYMSAKIVGLERYFGR